MAPEQLRGEPVTERSDQYSAAAVLFEAASGRRWKTLEVVGRRQLARRPPADDPPAPTRAGRGSRAALEHDAGGAPHFRSGAVPSRATPHGRRRGPRRRGPVEVGVRRSPHVRPTQRPSGPRGTAVHRGRRTRRRPWSVGGGVCGHRSVPLPELVTRPLSQRQELARFLSRRGPLRRAAGPRRRPGGVGKSRTTGRWTAPTPRPGRFDREPSAPDDSFVRGRRRSASPG